MTPTCPICGQTMRQRTGQYGAFYGCSRYPGCRGTRPIDPDADRDEDGNPRDDGQMEMSEAQKLEAWKKDPRNELQL